jgi:hypothetical protein
MSELFDTEALLKAFNPEKKVTPDDEAKSSCLLTILASDKFNELKNVNTILYNHLISYIPLNQYGPNIFAVKRKLILDMYKIFALNPIVLTFDSEFPIPAFTPESIRNTVSLTIPAPIWWAHEYKELLQFENEFNISQNKEQRFILCKNESEFLLMDAFNCVATAGNDKKYGTYLKIENPKPYILNMCRGSRIVPDSVSFLTKGTLYCSCKMGRHFVETCPSLVLTISLTSEGLKVEPSTIQKLAENIDERMELLVVYKVNSILSKRGGSGGNSGGTMGAMAEAAAKALLKTNILTNEQMDEDYDTAAGDDDHVDHNNNSNDNSKEKGRLRIIPNLIIRIKVDNWSETDKKQSGEE